MAAGALAALPNAQSPIRSGGMDNERLSQIHDALGSADRDLFDALERRAAAVRRLAELKAEDPDGYYTLPPEVEFLEQARKGVPSLPGAMVEGIAQQVLGVSESLLAPVSVAFAGPLAGFAHQAARTAFGSAPEFRALPTVAAVLTEVERQRVSFGVVPFENSTDGVLTATLHGLVEADVRIRRELTLAANNHLLSKTGNVSDVDKIFGTPLALSSAERFLRSNFPQATLVDVPSPDAAGQLSAEDHGGAALGNMLVARLYDLSVVKERVDDEAGVEFRFAVVGGAPPARTGRDRTVLALAVRDEPGALYKALGPLAGSSINLTRLESRPSRATAFRFVFFVEFDGHVSDRAIVGAMEELRGEAKFLKVLGSYPQPAGERE